MLNSVSDEQSRTLAKTSRSLVDFPESEIAANHLKVKLASHCHFK